MRSHLIAIFSCVLIAVLSAPARAQELPSTAVMRPTAEPALESAAAAIGRVVRARVEELGVVRAADTPAATFADLQLAVGCLSESMDCYRTIAGQLGAEALILTTLDQVSGSMVMTIAFVDTRRADGAKRVTRTFQGESLDNQALDAVAGMLYELFGVEPPADPADPVVRDAAESEPVESVESAEPVESVEPVEPTPGPEVADPIAPPPQGRPFPTTSVIVGAVGLVALAAGVGLGVASSNAEDEYASAPTDTAEQVDAALALRSTGERQALTANVLFAVGGVAIASSVLIYFLVDRKPDDDEMTTSIEAGPNHATLTFSGRFGAVQ